MSTGKVRAGSLAVWIGAALLAAPALWAQMADDGATGSSGTAAKSTAQPAKTETESKAGPAKADSSAAAADKPAGDPHIKPGSDYPHWEWFIGYSLLDAHFGRGLTGATPPALGPDIGSKVGNGGSTSIAYNVNRWFGLAADLGGYDIGTITRPGPPAVVSTGASGVSYLFGPRLNYRFGVNDRNTVFGQVLFGGMHGNDSYVSPHSSEDAFALALGGGLDFGITKHVAIRAAQLEYLMTRFDLDNTYRPQNDLRFSAGVLFRWGAKPITVNRPPTASCSADASSIQQGSGGAVGVRANASDPDGDSLTYAWSASGGRVEGSGPTARWIPGDAAPGTYTITARVDDGHGGTASCSANVTVEPKPAPRPPTMTCSVDRSSVLPGEVVNVTGNGYSPEGYPLDYSWRTSGGRLRGSGSNVQLDTSGLSPGDYSVTGRVTDGHGGAADCVAGLRVTAPAPKPQATKIGECIFKPGSTRVDNVCSRLLDDAVVRLQNDPNSKLVLIGYADPAKEKKGKVAETRANNAKKYVTQGKGKGTARVDASRVSTRAEVGVAGADSANRRVEVWQVPDGATF